MKVLTGTGCAVAMSDRDLGGAVLSRRSGMIDVGVVGCGYRVYGNDGTGVVDFGTPMATLSTNVRHWLHAGLGYPGSWRFVVRAFNGAGSERNLDRTVAVELDAVGEMEPVRPNGVTGLSARAMAGGKVEVSWAHEASGEAVETTHFHVYHDGGSGEIDYGIVTAEITRTEGGIVQHVWLSEVLEEAKVHRFAVRAASVEDVEDAGVQYVEGTPDGTAPEQPGELSGKVIH